MNQNVKPLIWVECLVEKHSRSRTEYLVKAKSQVRPWRDCCCTCTAIRKSVYFRILVLAVVRSMHMSDHKTAWQSICSCLLVVFLQWFAVYSAYVCQTRRQPGSPSVRSYTVWQSICCCLLASLSCLAHKCKAPCDSCNCTSSMCVLQLGNAEQLLLAYIVSMAYGCKAYPLLLLQTFQ